MAEYTLQFTVMKRVRADNADALIQVQREAQCDLEVVCSEGGTWSTNKGNARLVRIIRHRKPIAKTRRLNKHR